MTWKDINFETYRDLLYFYQNLDQYADELDKTIGLLVIFKPETNIDEMYKIPYIQIQEMVAPILEGIKEPMVYETIPYEPFETMNLGDWINIELYIREDNFEKVFETIYKGKVKYSEVGPVQVLEAYENLLKYRKAVYENYSEVFKLGGEYEEDPDETPEEREERLKVEEDSKNNSEWSWYLYLYDLAKGDILKFEEITEKNHLFIFNMLYMKKRFKLNEAYRGLF